MKNLTLPSSLPFPPLCPFREKLFRKKTKNTDKPGLAGSGACLRSCKAPLSLHRGKHLPAYPSPERRDLNVSVTEPVTHPWSTTKGSFLKVMKLHLKKRNTKNCSWTTETPQWNPAKHPQSSGNPHHMPVLSRCLFLFNLKFSWFTMLCQSLLYSKVTVLYVYTIFFIFFHYGLSQEIRYSSLC